MTYISDYLDNQHRLGQNVLLPDDYLCASLRCLWYLQVPSRHVFVLIMLQFPTDLPKAMFVLPWSSVGLDISHKHLAFLNT